MKKLRLLLITISLCLVSLAFFTGCTPSLSAPKNLKVTVATQVLSWDRVKHANGYAVSINGEERTTRSNSYTLANLAAGDYEIKVKAIGDGENFKDSDWVTYKNGFTREPETGLLYKLINNETEYELVGIGTASGEVKMESWYREKPVTSIGASALANSSKITSFEVSDTVKTINKRAFYNAGGLESIIIPNSVTSIGENAFQSCRKLTEITLPNSVTEIKEFTFSYCRGLTKINFGNQLTTIHNYAFSDCDALESIEIPNTVTRVGEYAFSGCKALASVKVGTGITEISNYTFYNCIALTDVTIGDNIKKIGNAAFGMCETLTTVNIPDSVTALGEQAFYGCKLLENVTLGNGLMQIGRFAFDDTKLFNDAQEIVTIGDWIISCKNKEYKDEFYSATAVGVADLAFVNCTKLTILRLPKARAIGSYAFYNCGLLVEVFLGEGTVYIGDYTFTGCSQMTKIQLGNALETIGNYAFFGCTRLQTVDLPDTVKSIGFSCFDECSGIWQKATGGVVYVDDWVVGSTPAESFTIKEGTRGIAGYSFYGQWTNQVTFASTIEYIGVGAFYENPFTFFGAMPASLKEIGDYAFYGCFYANFGEDFCLVLPEGLEKIGRSAFYQAQNLAGVSIPGTVKTIGEYAFYQCAALGIQQEADEEQGLPEVKGYLTIGEGVETISSRAFAECYSLIEVTLPNSLKSLGERSFYKCESLKNVTFGSGIDRIQDYTFYNCISLESVSFPSNVKSVGRYAFRGCKSLASLTLGGVATVGDYAFYGCSALEELAIPATLTTVNKYAFRNCNLGGVVIPETLTTIGQHAFYGNKHATFYCESDTILPYWSDRWNSYYRPVVWGCQLTENNEYVTSVTVTDTTFDNPEALNGITAPARDGYVCVEWTVTVNGTTTTVKPADVYTVEKGATLTPVWVDESLVEIPEEESPEASVEPSADPSVAPSVEGSVEPSASPSVEGTVEPSAAPSV